MFGDLSPSLHHLVVGSKSQLFFLLHHLQNKWNATVVLLRNSGSYCSRGCSEGGQELLKVLIVIHVVALTCSENFEALQN